MKLQIKEEGAIMRKCIRCDNDTVDGSKYCITCIAALEARETERNLRITAELESGIDYKAEYETLTLRYVELSDKYTALLELTSSNA
jgi:hypothetical protein